MRLDAIDTIAAPAHVRTTFSLRTGGVSKAPFNSLNLGDHVGDDAACVARNREIFTQTLSGAKPIFLKQVHGVDAIELKANTLQNSVADACWTTERGVACTIMVADCLPVLFAHRILPIVAAAHAGWRGLCGVPLEAQNSEKAEKNGVLEQIFKAISAEVTAEYAQTAINSRVNKTDSTTAPAQDWWVWLGPCIGPDAFEVGGEVRQSFVTADAPSTEHFKAINKGKYLVNLPALARQRLQALGITQIEGNDGSRDWCTVNNPSRFFSHRRDAARLGGSGRMAASIWLV